MGIADIPVVEDKAEIIEDLIKLQQITKQFRRGLITDDERYNALLQLNGVQSRNWKRLVPIVMMMDSGARGEISRTSHNLPVWSDGRHAHGLVNPFKLP